MPKIDTTAKIPYSIKGMKIHASKFLLSYDTPIFLKNVTSKIYGSWTKRNGYAQSGTTIDAGKTVQSLHSQRLADGTKRLMAYIDGDLKYNNSGTWTTILTGQQANAKARFLNYLGQTFVVGYDSDTDNYLTTFEITNLTAGYTNLDSAPNAKSIIEYQGQVYLANVEIGGIQYPSYMAYASVPALDGTITWNPTVTGMVGIKPDDGDQIVGSATGYGNMLVIKEQSTHLFNGDSQYPLASFGTLSANSIANVGQNVIFLHYGENRKVIVLYDGNGLIPISSSIEPILEGISETSAKNAVSGQKNGHLYMYIGDVTLDSTYSEYHKIPQTITKCLIDIDISHSSSDDPIISVYSLPISVTSMIEHNGSLYFGSSNGEVYEFDSGSDDDGTPIEGEIITNYMFGSDYNKKKTFKQVVINMHQRVSAFAWVCVDGEDWIPLGECTDKVNVFDLSNISDLVPYGYGVKFKIADYSTAGAFIYEGVEVEYEYSNVRK